MFGVPNAKYLAFGTPNESALTNFALHFNGTTDQDNHTASETLRTRIIINFLHFLIDKFATSLLK